MAFHLFSWWQQVRPREIEANLFGRYGVWKGSENDESGDPRYCSVGELRVVFTSDIYASATHGALETARNYIEHVMKIRVAAGYFSAVSDAYNKPHLVCADHRLAMLELAVSDSKWLNVHRWEALMDRAVSSYEVVSKIRDEYTNYMKAKEPRSWKVNPDARIFADDNCGQESGNRHVRMMFVCGEDVARCILTRSGWPNVNVERLMQNTELVVMPRPPSMPPSESVPSAEHSSTTWCSGPEPASSSASQDSTPITDLLKQPRNVEFAHRVHLVTADDGRIACSNISSSLVRHHVHTSRSIMYMTPSSVVEYIGNHRVFE